jgi:hypothetical protein
MKDFLWSRWWRLGPSCPISSRTAQHPPPPPPLSFTNAWMHIHCHYHYHSSPRLKYTKLCFYLLLYILWYIDSRCSRTGCREEYLDLRGRRIKLHNEELHHLYTSPSINMMNKSRMMKLTGHVAGMAKERNTCTILVWKTLVKQFLWTGEMTGC